jgi:polysaccharide biosynthesis protein PslH
MNGAVSGGTGGVRRRAGGRERLRILYICHRIPYPPDKGDRIRAYHQIRALAERHRLHLLTLCEGPVPRLDALTEVCEKVEVFPVSSPGGYLRAAAGAVRPAPLTLSFFHSRELAARVAALAKEGGYDAVVAFSSSMGPYAARLAPVPLILDMVDVDSAKWEQYARFAPIPLGAVYRLEAKRLRAYEAELARGAARVVLATAAERDLLAGFAPAARAVAIPNGVDLDFFSPLPLPKAKRPTLVFTGQMDYFANVDGIVHFADAVLPRLQERFPDLELLIVGRAPHRRVRALAERPGIHVTGAVGDVRPFLARAWVFVAPLRIAQGVQNKVLEALASNLPVVASQRVFAGLADGGFKDGEDLLVGGDDAALAERLAELLADPEARERLAAGGRRRLAAVYRWPASVARFEELVAEAVAERRSPAAAHAASRDAADAADTEGEARSA